MRYTSDDDSDERQYTVEYYAATYSGERTVWASDEEEAIAKVRAKIRKEMTLSNYADGYKIKR